MLGFIFIAMFMRQIAFGDSSIHNFADISCGNRLPSFRSAKIVGGQDATEGEFPWMVSLTRRGGHFCGGTILNRKFVLTAGHCVCSGFGATDFIEASGIKVTVAQHDLTKSSGNEYEVGVKKVITHEQYSCRKVRNDIAVLELEVPLEWSSGVMPACLPLGSNEIGYDLARNVLGTVAGWGWTAEESKKGGRAKALQKAKVDVLDNDKCQAWYKSQGKKTTILDSQMCAGFEQGGVDSCWADSGGPLMISSDEHTIVIGVVSTGIGCARPYLPGLYTRISEFIPWIEAIVQ